MIKDNRNNEQIYGRNDMIMLDPNNKIYGSLGLADNYVMKTEEGTRLVLNNPKQGRFGDVLTEFNICGRSSQFTTTGKNLADGQNAKYYLNNEVNLCGIGDNDTGMSIDVSKLTNVTISTKSIQDRYRVGCVDTVPTKGVNVTCYNGIRKDGTKDSYTIDTTGHNYLIVNATKLEDIQVEKGTEATSYEPYTGGIPSPSPEYPQEIKSVGDNGSVVVNVTGANVLEGTKLGVKSTVNGITYTTYENGILITGTATKDFFIVLHNDIIHPLTRGDYYLTTSGLNSSVLLNFYYVGKFVDDMQNIKVTLGKDVECSLRLQILKGATLNTTVQVSLTKSKITSYEPYYEEQTATLPYKLNAIPVSSGGNYIDQSGQQWIADYVDLHRGVKVQRIYNIDVDGENVKFEQAGGYANIFPRGLPIALYDKGQKVFAISTFTSSSWFFNTAYGQFLYLTGADISDKINESCKKQLGKIHYVLATPIETDLMPEEIEQYKKLSTKTPTTIVENNYNAWMKATYKSIESV